DDSTSGGLTSGDGSPAAGTDGDLPVATAAAGLEVLAVGTYQAALDAATGGKLGAVPPAVAQFVTTALGHHKEHLAAWNKVLADGGEPAVTMPNAALKPTVDAGLAKVTDAAGAAELALQLETIAAQTYLKAIPTLSSSAAVRLAGSIQVVDQQHQAILLYALGRYPVPDVFQKTDMAAI
ncbi:MAG: ferritin-like domain-containing protein, partial [Acidimicrobiia bacterium]